MTVHKDQHDGQVERPDEPATVTRGDLAVLFDLAVNSLDFGSGFWDGEDVPPARRIAEVLGVDPMVATPRSEGWKYPHQVQPYPGMRGIRSMVEGRMDCQLCDRPAGAAVHQQPTMEEGGAVTPVDLAAARVFRPSDPDRPAGAVEWLRNGDHPQDRVGEPEMDPVSGEAYTRLEGAVVRFYRRPDVSGDMPCLGCMLPWDVHGWVDSGGDGQVVHPGDYVTIPGEHADVR